MSENNGGLRKTEVCLKSLKLRENIYISFVRITFLFFFFLFLRLLFTLAKAFPALTRCLSISYYIEPQISMILLNGVPKASGKANMTRYLIKSWKMASCLKHLFHRS